MAKENGRNGNGNGAKAFGGLMAVVALITGVGFVVAPMKGEIDALRGEMDRRLAAVEKHATAGGHPATVDQATREVARGLVSHENLPGHPFLLANIASISEKFTEVETQFRGLRELSDLQFKLLTERIQIIEEWLRGHDTNAGSLDAAQWERIKSIERTVFGKARSSRAEVHDGGVVP